MDLLIKDAFIVDNNGVRKGDIGIEEGVIVSLDERDKTGEVIEGKGKIVIPGFYNTHTHIAMVFLRNIGEGLKLHDWLEKKIWPLERRVNEEVLYYSTMLGAIEALKSGTVCVNDMYLKFLRAMGKASNKVGIKMVLSYGIMDAFNDLENELKITEEFVKDKIDGRVKKAVACHSIYTCSEEALIRAKEIARKNDLLFHIHVSETRKEVFDCLEKTGLRPVEYLDKLGLLDEKTVLAHASWVTKREIRIISERKAVVSHNPISNLKLATGAIAPFEEYIKEGALATLGTDGPASNNNLDMIETMKVAGLLQKHKYWDATKGYPKDVFASATINGAVGLGYNSGLIEVGKDGDLVMIDPKENMIPFGDYYTSIVYSMKRDNVEKVFIKGELVYDRAPLKVKEEEIEKAKEKVLDYLNNEIMK